MPLLRGPGETFLHPCPSLQWGAVCTQSSLVSALSALRAASQPHLLDFTGMSHITATVLSKHPEIQIWESLISQQTWEEGKLAPPFAPWAWQVVLRHKHTNTLSKKFSFPNSSLRWIFAESHNLVFCPLLANPAQVVQPCPLECGRLTAYCPEASAEIETKRQEVCLCNILTDIYTVPQAELTAVGMDPVEMFIKVLGAHWCA